MLGKPYTGGPRLPCENVDFAQVVVERWANTLTNPVVTLNTIIGTQDSPFFPYPYPMSPEISVLAHIVVAVLTG